MLVFSVAALAASFIGGDDVSSQTTTTTSTILIATTTTSTTLMPKTYTVLSGESIFSIAEKFGLGMQAIIDLNKIDKPDKISAGDQILLPQGENKVAGAPTSSIVAPGTP